MTGKPKAYGSIDEVKEAAEPDGSLLIKAHDFGGKPFEILVTREEVAKLLVLFQEAAIRRANLGGPSLQMMEVNVTDVGLAHQGKQTAMMVSTAQIGALALVIPPELLDRLRGEIDRALVYLSGSSSIN